MSKGSKKAGKKKQKKYVSTNEENKTQEVVQNGNQNSETLKLLEKKSPNSVESEKSSIRECEEKSVVGGAPLSQDEGPHDKRKNSLEKTSDAVDNEESNQTLSGEFENPVLSEDLNSLTNGEVPQHSLENLPKDEENMPRSNITSRLPKTSSRSALPHNNSSRLPGELSGQPSVRNAKEDIKYWKNREQELLAKIADLETKVNEKEIKSTPQPDLVAKQLQEKLENDLVATTKEKENYKNRLQTIEKELFNKQKEITKESSLKNLKSSEEIISHLKLQNEDLRNALAKMTAILRDKTTMCISQEKKIAALVNQVESLKEVVAITKDLLNIRNMEVQHLSNDITAMETKIDCERQRHNQMLVKMDEAVRLNSELKKEYENQLRLFQQLRDSFEEKILLLSRNNPEKLDNSVLEKGNINERNSNSQVLPIEPK